MTCPFADTITEDLARAKDLIAALRQVNEDQREEIAEQREFITAQDHVIAEQIKAMAKLEEIATNLGAALRKAMNADPVPFIHRSPMEHERDEA